jgi:methyltransferase family protein
VAEKRTADPNRIHRIATGYMGTCVLLAALELNAFDELAGKDLSSQALAKALGLPPKPTERLLVALTSLGLVERKADKYVGHQLSEALDNPQHRLRFVVHDQTRGAGDIREERGQTTPHTPPSLGSGSAIRGAARWRFCTRTRTRTR